MKRFCVILSCALLAGALSCQKGADADIRNAKEIVLNIGDTFDAEVTTKGTKIESIPGSLYWGRSTGAAGSETDTHGPINVTGGGASIATGLYQTATPTTYNWYLSNLSFSHAAGGPTMSVANNATDVVVGYTSSNSSSVSITLNHIFACLGALSMTTENGYGITVNHWYISPSAAGKGTAGIYNLRTGAWSSTTPVGADTEVTSGSNNFYIPGEYSIKCNYTLTKGAFSKTYTKSATVNLSRGNVNNISGVATDDEASTITLNVSLESWGTQNHTGLTWN